MTSLPVRKVSLPPVKGKVQQTRKKPTTRRPKIVAVKATTPTILIDDRAGSKDLVKYPPLNECGELCRLSSADACFTGNGPDGTVLVGVEVKSILDLLQSMSTGRLQATQVPAMLAEYDVSWLLHYRGYTCGKNGELLVAHGKEMRPYFLGSQPMPYGYLEGHLITLTMAGVNVKRVWDVEEAAWWIGVLARWYGKPWSAHKSFHTFDRSRQVSLPPGVRDDPQLLVRARVAASLPGVGYERAMAVARHFKSVREMVEAGEKEWGEVVGVGKVIAKAVVEAMK